MSIEQIKTAASQAGSHFFDEDTMRFFSSRVLSAVHEGPGGVYFVTSERDRHQPDTDRRYTVRRFHAGGSRSSVIATVWCFQAYSSARQALREAARLAAGAEKGAR